jgi:hypothetical protein
MPMPASRSLVTTKTQIGASTTVVAPLSVRDAWAVVVLTAVGVPAVDSHRLPARSVAGSSFWSGCGRGLIDPGDRRSLPVVPRFHSRTSARVGGVAVPDGIGIEALWAICRTVALIDCDDGDGGDQHADGVMDLPFPPAVAQAVRSRLTPWTSEAGCRVYHLQ